MTILNYFDFSIDYMDNYATVHDVTKGILESNWMNL